MLSLISSPPSLRRLVQEIDSRVATGQISSPIRNSEALAFPYLQAVIRESLRMYPPVTAALLKVVPPSGDTVPSRNGGSVHLPGGTLLGHDLYGILRSRDLWGDDTDVFRPERWLEAEEESSSEKGRSERLRTMIRNVDLVFGTGKFQCLGKSLATIELNKVFVELLRRYDFSLCQPEAPLSIWSAGAWVITDFWLRATKRT